MSSIITALQDKDDKKAFEKTKEIAAESEFSDKYYTYLEEFAVLLTNPKSYIRVRAFILCCSQAKWDKDGKLKKYCLRCFSCCTMINPPWSDSVLMRYRKSPYIVPSCATA